MLRIRSALALEDRQLRLTLTDGSVVERDIQDLLVGQVFDRLRVEDAFFRRVRARHGTVTWPGDVDIVPETLIWDGPEPAEGTRPAAVLRPRSPGVLRRDAFLSEVRAAEAEDSAGTSTQFDDVEELLDKLQR